MKIGKVFETDSILQELFAVACIEGREDELRDESDIYHLGFETIEQALRFGFNLGEFMGHYHFGEQCFEFRVPESDSRMYFIGSYEEVKKKIYKAL